eukprot:1159215-Pelagomonas_calceolata.AAC.13
MVLLAGYGLFYRLYGLPYPWLQALGVHAASFLVSCAVDARYRCAFHAAHIHACTRAHLPWNELDRALSCGCALQVCVPCCLRWVVPAAGPPKQYRSAIHTFCAP